MAKATTIAGPKRSASTVIVASKLPMTIEIQLCRAHSVMEQGRYGPVEAKVFVRDGDVFRIRGTARIRSDEPKGYVPPEMIAGFSITRGIPADFWEKWAQQNQSLEFVRNGLVFAFPDLASIGDAAKDVAALRSGLEALDMADPDSPDPRVPRPTDPNVQIIKTGLAG